MQLPTWANLARLTLALSVLACRDAPQPILKVASAGAQAPTRVVQAQAALNVSRRTALVAAADRVSPAVVSINVTPAIQAERGIRSERGALIFRLSPQVSRATGLQAGDVILAINRSPVRNASEVSELLNVRPGPVVRIYVERDAQVTFTDLVFR